MYSIDELKNAQGPALYGKAQKILPGGAQLFSKRSELFAPGLWPAYYSKAKGSKVWDLEGREFLDMSIMGVGANILGYADDDVDDAVVNALRSGASSSLNCAEDVELAELLIDLHPWAEAVRYARCGGEAMMVALRIARAATGRDTIFFNGYHGWGDWYLAANLGESNALDGQLMPGLAPRGVPRSLKGTARPFDLGQLDALETMLAQHGPETAAIVIEPARGEHAPAGSLQRLRELASKYGTVLIFDEITSGFRMNPGGIHLLYDVIPDIAVFAKGMANGYPMAAVLGKKDVMAAVRTTFISSTNWSERIGPTAALATIRKYIKHKVHERIIASGNAVKKVWSEAASHTKLNVNVSGLPSLAALAFTNEDPIRTATYFTQEMLRRGILGFRQFKPAWAHSPADIGRYGEAVEEIFQAIAKVSPKDLPVLETAQTGFYRLTKE